MIIDDKTLEEFHAIFKNVEKIFSEIAEEAHEIIQSVSDAFEELGSIAVGAITAVEKRLRERAKWLYRYPKTVKVRMIDKRVRCYHCRNNC